MKRHEYTPRPEEQSGGTECRRWCARRTSGEVDGTELARVATFQSLVFHSGDPQSRASLRRLWAGLVRTRATDLFARHAGKSTCTARRAEPVATRADRRASP